MSFVQRPLPKKPDSTFSFENSLQYQLKGAAENINDIDKKLSGGTPSKTDLLQADLRLKNSEDLFKRLPPSIKQREDIQKMIQHAVQLRQQVDLLLAPPPVSTVSEPSFSTPFNQSGYLLQSQLSHQKSQVMNTAPKKTSETKSESSSSGITDNYTYGGVTVTGPANLVAIVKELIGDLSSQFSDLKAAGITAIKLEWTDGKTSSNSMTNTIFLSTVAPKNSSETIERFRVRALRAEMQNLASSKGMSSSRLDFLAMAFNEVEQAGGKIEDVSVERQQAIIKTKAASAISTELHEMANMMRNYLKKDQSYAAAFKSGTANAVKWLMVQIEARHTAEYDANSVNDTWKGYEIIDTYKSQLTAIPVSETGVAQLEALAKTIGALKF